MRRHASLLGFSREHHTVLYHALELRRATPQTAAEVRDRFLGFWAEQGTAHFEREEADVLPVLAPGHPLVAQVLAEHAQIAALVEEIADDEGARPALLRRLGESLTRHVRLEERELFPLVEAVLPAA